MVVKIAPLLEGLTFIKILSTLKDTKKLTLYVTLWLLFIIFTCFGIMWIWVHFSNIGLRAKPIIFFSAALYWAQLSCIWNSVKQWPPGHICSLMQISIFLFFLWKISKKYLPVINNFLSPQKSSDREMIKFNNLELK